MNYYNEIDQFCCAWLANLIDAEVIPPGHIDSRSIKDVTPDDVRGYTQCHFFCGIAGWPLALKIAGATGECWTGSPPCQDFSVAQSIHGKRAGLDGERSGLAHTWLNLVGAIKPGVVLFENVPGIEPWLAEIKARLAGFGYRVRGRKRAASDIGAPHQRRRVWLFADRDGARLQIAGAAGPPTAERSPWASAPRRLWQENYPRSRVLDDGVPNRMACIRAFGNAVVPPLAAEFIRSIL